MGFFDFLPCCGRSSVDKHDESTESDPLLAPGAAESITSQEGYGATSMPTDGGLSGKQRERIAEIGREVGNHMLPINHASRAATTSPTVRQPSTQRAPSPDSSSSPSRPTTPSPHGDRDDLSPIDGDDRSTSATRSGAATPTSVAPDADGVVHKQLFHGTGGAKRGGGPGGRGKKGGRGRGRGRSKKMK